MPNLWQHVPRKVFGQMVLEVPEADMSILCITVGTEKEVNIW